MNENLDDETNLYIKINDNPISIWNRNVFYINTNKTHFIALPMNGWIRQCICVYIQIYIFILKALHHVSGHYVVWIFNSKCIVGMKWIGKMSNENWWFRLMINYRRRNETHIRHRFTLRILIWCCILVFGFAVINDRKWLSQSK